ISSAGSQIPSATITGNLIYSNAGAGIDLPVGAGYQIIGNTIVQSVGNAISLSGGANSRIADNIVWSDLGTGINIAANSLSGLTLDYNLYYRGASNAANVAVWGATTYTSLASWQAGQMAQNQHSVEGNPDFIDMNGADNVLGGPDTGLGGGADD